MPTKKIAIVVGTRPEVIKCAPLVFALRESAELQAVVIATGQHRELAEKAFADFGIEPDINLALMRENQSPNELLATLLTELEAPLRDIAPRAVVVQGDTTTALGSALAAFHLQIPVAHVEAGLRTHDMRAPFPEEMNRCTISHLASFHFCPTPLAEENLRKEGITKGIHLVGNTVVDALRWMEQRIDTKEASITESIATQKFEDKKFILVTGHRRENFDGPLEHLCDVLLQLVREHEDLEIVYPVHLNPNVQRVAHDKLQSTKGVHLVEPVDYPTALFLMKHATLIITDSGGIQEEAPSLGTPFLVTRSATERPEALEAGCGILVDLKEQGSLYAQAKHFLSATTDFSMPRENPFGDGTAAAQIRDVLCNEL